MTVLGGDMASGAVRREACARIAFMPQGLGRNLYPTLSVAENLDFFARLFGQQAAERAPASRTCSPPPASRPSATAGGQALRRHEAEARNLCRPHP